MKVRTREGKVKVVKRSEGEEVLLLPEEEDVELQGGRVPTLRKFN